jgi:hypothetical protein
MNMYLAKEANAANRPTVSPANISRTNEKSPRKKAIRAMGIPNASGGYPRLYDE